MKNLSHNKTIRNLCRNRRFHDALDYELNYCKHFITHIKDDWYTTHYISKALTDAAGKILGVSLYGQIYGISRVDIIDMTSNLIEILSTRPDWQ